MKLIQESNLEFIQKFQDYRESQGKSNQTLKNGSYILKHFSQKTKIGFREIKQDHILNYVSDEKYNILTLSGRYVALDLFYRWMLKQHFILRSPIEKIPRPRVPKLLPQKIMTIGETQKVLRVNSKNSSDPYEFRNRSILEMMYSCSLRRSEIIGLKLSDIDFVRKSLLVRSLKTQKERIVPIGKVALKLLEIYIKKYRPKVKSECIFISKKLKPLSSDRVSKIAFEARKKSGIRTKATSHSFRKSSATHMLRNGASMYSVQELLGHSALKSTEVYTKVYPRDLVKMHRAHHPREKQKNYKLPDLKAPHFFDLSKKLFKPSIVDVSIKQVFVMHRLNHAREREDLPSLKVPKFINGSGHLFISHQKKAFKI